MPLASRSPPSDPNAQPTGRAGTARVGTTRPASWAARSTAISASPRVRPLRGRESSRRSTPDRICPPVPATASIFLARSPGLLRRSADQSAHTAQPSPNASATRADVCRSKGGSSSTRSTHMQIARMTSHTSSAQPAPAEMPTRSIRFRMLRRQLRRYVPVIPDLPIDEGPRPHPRPS